MTQPTHNDLHRDIGGLERGQADMERRLDRIEELLEGLRADIADLKMRDGQRSALEKAGVWLAGVLGAAVALLVQHFWK